MRGFLQLKAHKSNALLQLLLLLAHQFGRASGACQLSCGNTDGAVVFF